MFTENLMFFSPELARKIGLHEAIIAGYLYDRLQTAPEAAIDGRLWVSVPLSEFQAHLPYISEKTIRRALKKLEAEGILLTGAFNDNRFNRTRWYTLDYRKVDELLGGPVRSDCPDGQDGHFSNELETSAGLTDPQTGCPGGRNHPTGQNDRFCEIEETPDGQNDRIGGTAGDNRRLPAETGNIEDQCGQNDWNDETPSGQNGRFDGGICIGGNNIPAKQVYKNNNDLIIN
ncbi:MAG: hypothetical protein HPY81_11460 [Firmicutes bacterium]|nr:hypothetical protein [Bacillota bacterium]